MDFGASISKQFKNIANLIIGIILSVIPIINILTIPGYFLRIANRTMNKDNSLPGFDNFGELVVNSLKMIVVGIVYGVIGFIVAFVLMLIPVAGLYLAVIWCIIWMFVSISAMMLLAKAGNLGDAFKFGEVFGKAKNGGFVASVIVGAIVAAIIMVVVMLILLLIFAASMLGVFLAAMSNPMALSALLMGLFGSMLIGIVILGIVAYIVSIFFYSFVASAYPQ